MKALRVSMYPPNGDPVMVVLREPDLSIPIEQARQEQENFPAGFVISEIFELAGEPEIMECSVRAVELQQAALEREQHMALTYYWFAGWFSLARPGGVISMTKPAPLSAADLQVPLRQLANHPNYDQYTVITISDHGEVVELREGVVTTARMADDAH